MSFALPWLDAVQQPCGEEHHHTALRDNFRADVRSGIKEPQTRRVHPQGGHARIVEDQLTALTFASAVLKRGVTDAPGQLPG